MKIKYYKKCVYGSDLLYIVDKAEAEAVRRLTNKLTINEGDIKALQVIGVQFEQVLN